MKKIDIDLIAKITDLKLTDPKKFKTSEAVRAYAQNRTEQHKRNLKDSMEKRGNNQEWRVNHKVAAQTRDNSNQSAAAQKRYKNKDYATNISKGNQQRFSKCIVTPWGKFPSRRQAIDVAKTQGIINPSGKIDRGVKIPASGFFYMENKDERH